MLYYKCYLLQVEEHVEEITSSYQLYEADSDSIIECSNTSYNVIERHRAPFPELGKDVVDGNLTFI